MTAFKFTYNINNTATLRKLKNMQADTRVALRKAWYFIGKDLVFDAKDLITNPPKSGRIYAVYKNGRRTQHQASASGEAPANITGTLKKSIGFNVHGWQRLEFGATADYAKRLEEPMNRPFLKTAIKKNDMKAANHFENQLQKLLLNLRS